MTRTILPNGDTLLPDGSTLRQMFTIDLSEYPPLAVYAGNSPDLAHLRGKVIATADVEKLIFVEDRAGVLVPDLGHKDCRMLGKAGDTVEVKNEPGGWVGFDGPWRNAHRGALGPVQRFDADGNLVEPPPLTPELPRGPEALSLREMIDKYHLDDNDLKHLASAWLGMNYDPKATPWNGSAYDPAQEPKRHADDVRREIFDQVYGRSMTHVLPRWLWTLATPGDTPPTTRCYWVVKDRLLAGAYPFGKRVEELWDAGVRTFVDLVEEQTHSVTGESLESYVPTLEKLSKRDGDPFEVVRAPLPDHHVPGFATPEGHEFWHTVERALDAVDRSMQNGKSVYVHCVGGIGRTGMVVGCWLKQQGLAGQWDVIEALSALRKADKERAARKSPETMEQERVARYWFREMFGEAVRTA